MSQLFKSVLGASSKAKQVNGGVFNTVTEDLFKPYLWVTNGPLTDNFTTVSNGNTLQVPFTSHLESNYIGLRWESVDVYSHEGLRYHDYLDYTGVVFVFDVLLSATMAIINEPDRALTLDIDTSSDGKIYVPLAQYASAPGTRASTITLDFDNLVGNRASDGISMTVDPTTIERVTIGLVADTYAADSYDLNTTPQDCLFTLTWISVTGGAAFTRNNVQAATHSLGLSTSYDDSHNTTPERMIKTMKALGYTGKINHYCGMSKYPNRQHINGLQQIIETAGNTINPATVLWHESYAALLVAEGWECIWSVSYEMFSVFANTNYAQRDYNGILGETGYTPTSYLLSPCVTGSMEYLANVFVDFANIMDSQNLPVIMQVGEPWWWFHSDTRKPCLYHYDVAVKFNNDTGLYAPDIPTIDDLANIDINDNTPLDIANDTLEQTFIKWCRDELGLSTLYLKDAVKLAHPTAKMTALFFIPSILTDSVGLIKLLNYPKAHYQKPNFDFFMTEAYDWVINGEMQKADQVVTMPVNELGYLSSEVECLVGFVPDETLADAFGWEILDDNYKRELWARVIGSTKRNENYNPSRQYVWAYNQVVDDNVIVNDGNNFEILEREVVRPTTINGPPKSIRFYIEYVPPETTLSMHVIGDSFVDNDTFMDILEDEFGNRYVALTADGVGATTLAQQAVRFDSTPEYYDSTLVIMDGGLEDTQQAAIDSIDSMVAHLTHNRWVWVQPSPSTFKLGTPARDFNDTMRAAIAAHVGVDHYVETLDALLAGNDGSANDLQDVADGLVPRSLRLDFIHENEAGQAIGAKQIADFIRAKGW